jgi:shikimate dehydrogenase
MARKFAVLGSPIGHSLSPKIHRLILSKLEPQANYESFEVSDNLSQFLDDKLDYAGFSVTMPLKDQAFQLAKVCSDVANQTQSVNTLYRSSNGLAGFNTDVFGIQRAIGFTPKSVAVLGSGATARSALAAFANSSKAIYARNSAAADDLSKKFKASTVPFEVALEAEVVISTLPAGVLPELIAGIRQPNILLDVAYTNPPIPAERYVSGLAMLIHQAIAQQRIFQSGSEETSLKNEAELVEELFLDLNVAK